MEAEIKDRIRRAEDIQRYTENRCETLEKENAALRQSVAESEEIIAELKAHCKAVDEVNVKMRNCKNCDNEEPAGNWRACMNCENFSNWELKK